MPPPTDEDVTAWARACRATAEVTEGLLALLAEAQGLHREWRQQIRLGQVEIRKAVTIRNAEIVYIPGLLQTADYARCRIEEGVRLHNASPADVDAATARRMQRQQVLYDITKTFQFVVTEAALRFLLCPPTAMIAQLDRLLRGADRSGVPPAGGDQRDRSCYAGAVRQPPPATRPNASRSSPAWPPDAPTHGPANTPIESRHLVWKTLSQGPSRIHERHSDSRVRAMTGRILVTGATGHLGTRVAALAAAAGWSVVGTYFRAATQLAGDRLDVRDPGSVGELIRRVRPDVVIHTAASRDDWRVAADGAAYVAVAAAAQGCRLVHVSSDAVFSGREVNYDESALPDPVYQYGAAKAAAETAVRAIDPAAAVVRTSLILGHGRGQHEILTRDLIAGRVGGALFTDMIRKPVHVDDLAAALLELASSGYRGVLNVAGPDAVNRYDLGVLIARREGLDPARIPVATIADSGMRLPTDVRLCTDRARSILRTRLRGVYEFIGGLGEKAPAVGP